MKRIGIYCRVSSSDQVLKGFSLETQQKNGIEFCDKNGFLYLIYRDEGKSGFDTKKRDSYNKLLNDIRSGVLDGVWVINIDRVNRNLLNSQEFLTVALAHEIKVYENGIEIDLDDINDRFGYSMRSLIAEYNRENNRRRVIQSKLRKIKEGYFISGSTPFGYDRSEKELLINNEEAGIIKEIFSLIEKGLSRNAVSVELKLRYGGEYLRRTYKKKILFSSVWVGRLLKSRYYVDGIFRYRFMQEIGEVKCEPIILPGFYNHVISNIRVDKGTRERQRKSFLEGRCYCFKCKKKMILSFQKGWPKKDGTHKQYYYFRCQDKECLKGEWKKKNILIEDYEAKVDKFIRNFILDTDFFKDEVRRVLREEMKRRTMIFDSSKKNRKLIENKITKESLKMERLTEVYIDGKINKEEYKKRNDAIEVEIQKLRSLIEDNVEPSMDHITKIEKEFEKFNGSTVEFLDRFVDRIIVRVVKRSHFYKGRLIKLKFVFKGLKIDERDVEREIRSQSKNRSKNNTLCAMITPLTSNIFKTQKVFIYLIISDKSNNTGVEVEIDYLIM